ncbi:SWIM zinc finger family protein [Nocardioides sp.]|uniref:SWIM zinc finger family protein n=1 Tax=Nocardioides sp. TaxID=35761 RepID=UPI0039E3770A
MSATVHPRQSARKGGVRLTGWWAKAWLRAVEETAYDERELAAGRALGRGGAVGGIIVDAGSFAAAVEDGRGMWTVSGTLPVLDTASVAALVEAVAAVPARIAGLLAGDLPHELVEHAEELGVELLPFGGELGSVCSCDAWVDPCVHALAVMTQLGWLLERDPFVLLQLRGVGREDLLARLHAFTPAPALPDSAGIDDLDIAFDAAVRAARLLQE